jgi:hypothetical protein
LGSFLLRSISEHYELRSRDQSLTPQLDFVQKLVKN